MHCDCCDKLLNNVEATARWSSDDPLKLGEFVNMCVKCQSTLPKALQARIQIKDIDPNEGIEEIDEAPEYDDYDFDKDRLAGSDEWDDF